MFFTKKLESSACGVGFVANRKNLPSHSLLRQALDALRCVEHRGACAADNVSADGVGVMTDIPFELFGYDRGSVAVATLFLPTKQDRLRLALKVFEETFAFMGMKIIEYREVPVDLSVLGPEARSTLPTIKHVIISRPSYCRTDESFNKLLYAAKQATRTKERLRGIVKEFFFTSLSTTTIVYKGLVRSDVLDKFYLDLRNPCFKTRFALFHRRFSTNTRTAWDKAQPFRLIGHNGEINTIAGNRSWSYAREKAIGVPVDELLTHDGISDSGSLNEMVEALKYRSSIPRVDDALAIMMPPADQQSSFYRFWSRAMEPWDGPAFITYSDGETIGARLDRNGFRPCRWTMTDEHFYLCSEAGSFAVDDSLVTAKGALHAGTGVTVDLASGEVHFEDPSHSRENRDVQFDPRLAKMESVPRVDTLTSLDRKHLFSYSDEDIERILVPMIATGKEPIGSMGDTARPAVLSTEARSFFDYFYQDFAQVTNPPLDYMREAMVTDLVTHVGARPNIFAPKELIPPAPAIELASPVLSLGQMEYLRQLPERLSPQVRLVRAELPMTFVRDHGSVSFRSALERLGKKAIDAVAAGATILILSDRSADSEHPPVPSLLALRAVEQALIREGISLHASLVVDSGEVRRTHDVAALISFGATAVCPHIALEIARGESLKELEGLEPDVKEHNLVRAFEQGLLKVMSKMGISVVRSYQGAQLFTALGLGQELISEYFPRLSSPIGGVSLDTLASEIVSRIEDAPLGKLLKTYQFKEHNRGQIGERHSMTNARSRIIHQIARDTGIELSNPDLYREYLKSGEETEPVNIRHLLKMKSGECSLDIEEVEPVTEILRTFGSGAMSFGAISAESQRDIIEAMRIIGGRSNSGEGGENPYYYSEGTCASIKQVASGRFGVTAEYLVTAREFQIKIAQGAKPGEGGQLMGVKVTVDIARARHSHVGIDLISPPPLHDIYSIEDLKQLIYELKQFNPEALVNVKLVSGANIGTIALGVAKAGADVIHVSGHDGGTGAAPLSSMKHAGLPWELGLVEVHQALVRNGLRESVTLRTDGGLHTGKDIVIAAMLGAEEYEFGKLLLIAEGCVMARICEKNTCPAGIATHDPKFKAKYKGSPEAVVKVLTTIADDVRGHLARLGIKSLKEIVGRIDLLEINDRHADLIEQRGLDLGLLLDGEVFTKQAQRPIFSEKISALNLELVRAYQSARSSGGTLSVALPISSNDRAVLASVSAEIAREAHGARMARIRSGVSNDHEAGAPSAQLRVQFTGSAGQGFGVFLTDGLDVELVGEGNDSVCKAISGGRVVIRPRPEARFDPACNTIIGNCALYGATGGTVFVHGRAGDRFAVRNSGAVAVIEGAGLHACEYMTNGTVVILGAVSHNVGAGMTGGVLYLNRAADRFVNKGYVRGWDLTEDYEADLRRLLEEYVEATSSEVARSYLSAQSLSHSFTRYVPVAVQESPRQSLQVAKTGSLG